MFPQVISFLSFILKSVRLLAIFLVLIEIGWCIIKHENHVERTQNILTMRWSKHFMDL